MIVRVKNKRPRCGEPTLIAFNKPYGVLCQFSRQDGKATLADYIDLAEVYPAGRLDYDSEGLVLLTDDGGLQHSIAHPGTRLEKTYWVEVEQAMDDAELERGLALLRSGVRLNDGPTLPARAQRIAEPAGLWPRDPPVRFRKSIPTAWIELGITEGRNRQVRRMTAAVGAPTLRLVRAAIGTVTLQRLGLEPGAWTRVDTADLKLQF